MKKKVDNGNRRTIYLLQKKTKRVYVWLVVDRNGNQVVDFEVTKSRNFSSYYKLATRIEARYTINILCTDPYDVYSKHRISNEHCVSKVKTSLVEANNSLIRNYLASFNRKTKLYYKTFNMIGDSLMLLLHNILYQLLFSNTQIYLQYKLTKQPIYDTRVVYVKSA